MDVIHCDGELFVAGPDTAARLVRDQAGRRFGAVRFAPGQGPGVLGVSAEEMRDLRVPLGALWPGPRVRRLTERLDAAIDPAAELEEAVLEWAVRANGRDPGPDPLAARLLAGLRSGRPVAALAAEVGLSERQLHRRSLHLFGYGLKTLSRILRLTGALDLARGGAAYGTVAATAGYADQAHLARDVKALAGVPMGELLKT